MDSYAIIDWLEQAHPDAPSVYLPSAAAGSGEVRAAREAGAKELAEFRRRVASFQEPFIHAAFDLCRPKPVCTPADDSVILTAPGRPLADGPRILPTFSPQIQEYWISDARMGEGEWQKTLDADQGKLGRRLTLSPCHPAGAR